MAARAARPASVLAVMTCVVSYQMPANALPNAGLSRSTAVLATIRSMISPGICEESNTDFASGDARISETSGFQVTTALTDGVL